MSEAIKLRVLRAMIENLVISGFIFCVIYYWIGWAAYVSLGILVASVLGGMRAGRIRLAFIPLVFIGDLIFWPAQVVINVVKSFSKVEANGH